MYFGIKDDFESKAIKENQIRWGKNKKAPGKKSTHFLFVKKINIYKEFHKCASLSSTRKENSQQPLSIEKTPNHTNQHLIAIHFFVPFP